MKITPKITLLILSLLLVIAFFYFYTKPKTPAQKPVTVSLAPVVQKDVTLSAHAVGNVQAYNTVNVKSLVDGQILRVGFKQGDEVVINQVLFEIDPRPFQAQLAQAQANLARDQANLTNALRIVERNKSLVEKGFIARKDFEDLVTTATSLQGTIKADQAAINTAKIQLGYTIIRSPINGKTGNLLVQIGNLAKANDPNPLVVINQIKPIYVNFTLPGEQLPTIQMKLAQGPLWVTALIGKEKNIRERGVLSFVDNTINEATGTIALKATFQNDKRLLWPGQFVNVEVPLSFVPKALLIPTVAIQVGQDGEYVFVVKNNTAHLRPVKVGQTISDQTIILQGLAVNDIVVTEGQLGLVDGTIVKAAAAQGK